MGSGSVGVGVAVVVADVVVVCEVAGCAGCSAWVSFFAHAEKVDANRNTSAQVAGRRGMAL